MRAAVIRVHLEAQPEGGYTVTSPDLQGLVTEGETIEECLENAQEVARLLYESYVRHGDPLPEVF
ncbi:MAG TPA: type II toxin-antitoxin system HicB family antitoxin, partial [bacterium]|nr:type II toxin-antitoxin system HicB family antitoxin [bacterium]